MNNDKRTIVVTGGLGYIGSHISTILLNRDWNVIIIDNCSNAESNNLENIKRSTLKNLGVENLLTFYQTDLCIRDEVDEIFKNHHEEIFGVIHCAGYKAVGESVQFPISYYRNNIDSTLTLLESMQKYGIKNLVFSSSATVYGFPKELPLIETSPIQPINPYGQTKYMIEIILQDLYNSDSLWNIAILRYFNPIGAHSSGYLGDKPKGTPNNLMPYLVQVIEGKQKYLQIFGDDYDTHDGTGVRDYIHILDLVEGHICAIDKMYSLFEKNNLSFGIQNLSFGIQTFNLGTGKGYSVLEILKTMESLIHRKIPYEVVERRTGDTGTVYANADKAKEILGWSPKYNLFEMCQDSLNSEHKS